MLPLDQSNVTASQVGIAPQMPITTAVPDQAPVVRTKVDFEQAAAQQRQVNQLSNAYTRATENNSYYNARLGELTGTQPTFQATQIPPLELYTDTTYDQQMQEMSNKEKALKTNIRSVVTNTVRTEDEIALQHRVNAQIDSLTNRQPQPAICPSPTYTAATVDSPDAKAHISFFNGIGNLAMGLTVLCAFDTGRSLVKGIVIGYIAKKAIQLFGEVTKVAVYGPTTRTYSQLQTTPNHLPTSPSKLRTPAENLFMHRPVSFHF